MTGQIWAVAVLNIQSIVSRSGASAVIVVGTGGVVGVLTLVLSMAGGLDAVFKNSMEPDRAIVLRDGSTDEMSSVIPGNHLSLIRSIPEVAIAAGELYGVADIEKRSSGTPANLVVRGTEAQSFQVRPELSITQGRNFQPRRNEAIVGVGAHREFLGLDVGSQIEVRGTKWLVVGLFEDDGSATESEIWVDLPMAASAFRRGNTLTTVRLRLNRPEGLNAVNENMKANPQLQTKAVSEERFYSEQSEGATKVIRVFGNVVVVIMAIGAIFAALNTMYSAVAARTFEIATLRA
ncbi:MAG: ABC transporter permease, partial [Pseudomonadales bacterium]|nr:ABC transporter permease [Pseudomonadales bacterium]